MANRRHSSDEWEPEEGRMKEFQARNNGKLILPTEKEAKRSCKVKSLRCINSSQVTLMKVDSKEEASLQLLDPRKQKAISDALVPAWTQNGKITNKGGKTRRDLLNADSLSMNGAQRFKEVGKLTKQDNDNDNAIDEDRSSGGSRPLFSSSFSCKLSNNGPTNASGKKTSSVQFCDVMKRDGKAPRRGSKRVAPELTTAKSQASVEESWNENGESAVEDTWSCQNDAILGVPCTFGAAKNVKLCAEWDKCSQIVEASEHSEGVGSSSTSIYQKLEPPMNLHMEELWQDPCIAFAIQTLTGTSFESVSMPHEVSSGKLLTSGCGSAVSETVSKTVAQSYGVNEWSDPCIEFAIKTLTGAIPLDYTMVLQKGSSQNWSTSHSQVSDRGEEFRLLHGSGLRENGGT